MAKSRPGTASKRKHGAPASTNASFLGKLQMLREFVPSGMEESDLSLCLRQCGCNVELAAERLITGQFQPQKSTFFGMSTSSSPGRKLSAEKPAVKRARTSSESAVQRSASTPAPRSKPANNVARALKPAPSTSKKAPSTDSQANLVTPPGNAGSENGMHLLLCQRWVVGWSTTKFGSVAYQESLKLTHSSQGPPMVRFKGKGVEGTLQPDLCAVLTPLLRHETPLLSIVAEALMEIKGINIGEEVPVALKIYIEEPQAFFGLFEGDSTVAVGSAAAQFFGAKKASSKKNRLRLPCAEAAFGLLQWAEYGDKYHFEPAKQELEDIATEKSVNGASSDSEEEELLGEDQFAAESASKDEEEVVQEWAEDVVNDASASKEAFLPEATDPVGLKDSVELRPYQRQALQWMLTRESGDEGRDEMEKELQLLSELARTDAQTTASPTSPANMKEPIMCEVGPVRVSPDAAANSRTIDGVKNPVNHPLWQRRFLATRNMEWAISFYVNELIGIASATAPNPPNHCVGGIQGDSMGLGKTVMMLSLILKSKEATSQTEDGDSAGESAAPFDMVSSPSETTLVVTPLSLLAQWEEEIATRTVLKHRVHYGDSGSVHAYSFKNIDVVLTTYGTLQGELHAAKKKNISDISTGLLSYEWGRVILDEAHCIKNPSTLVSRACCMLKAQKRWCVTGTPIQNNLQDVYALLKFLRHEPWCEVGFWKAAITNANQTGAEKSVPFTQTQSPGDRPVSSTEPTGSDVSLGRVRRLLAPLILRRTKDSLTSDGKPILVLPPVETVTVKVELSPPERDFYTSLLAKSQSVFEGYIKSGTAGKSRFAIFSLLNRLRQTCDHVALTVKSHMDESDWNPLLSDSPAEGAAKAATPSPKRATKDQSGLDDAFLGDLLQKFHQTHASEKEPTQHTQEEEPEFKYASSVAHVLDKAVKASATHLEDECPLCLDPPQVYDAVITPCAHIFCRVCLIEVLEDNRGQKASGGRDTSACPNGECPVCKEMIDSQRIITLSKSNGRTTTVYLADASSTKVIQSPPKKKPSLPTSIARQTLENSLRGAGSSKLTAVVEELHKVWDMDPGSKVLIFSQFLGFLDFLQVSLRKQSIPFDRLDGKLSLKERVAVMDRFRNSSHTVNEDDGSSKTGSVLLISMKAGGVGLNLTAASTVFLVDPWWNAAVEDQCLSRIYRLGQTAKIVRVRKFIVQDSVEERIVLLQQRKKDVAREILQSNTAGTMANNNARPTLDDLRLLFQN